MQFIYVPDDEDVVPLRYAEIESVAFSKQQRKWRVIEVTLESGDLWAMTVLPSTARIARRKLRRESPALLSSKE